MKYSITKEQLFFFENNLFIEFEELLSKSEVDSLLRGVENALQSSIEKKVPEEIFLHGRDLVHLDEKIRKVLFSPRLGQIARALSMSKTLRFGFDQLYSGPKEGEKAQKTFSCLNDESCIRELSCALMICLRGSVSEKSHSDSGIDPFPTKPGSGIFFLSSVPCNPMALQYHEGQLFLLLSWAKERALYVFEPRDPHTHKLKKSGHVFGDRLTAKYHPIIVRNV
jgi:hypothetical protein